jgi:nitrogen fixation protein FixH
MNPDMQNSGTKTTWKLKGRHVLAAVVGFFGFLIVANAAFINMAVSTHRGEDVRKSYRQGLEYNAQIARRAAQVDLGWVIDLDYGEKQSVITITNAEGETIKGLEIIGTLRHPVDRNRDEPLVFEETRAGVYIAPLPEVEGRWNLRAEALDAPMTLQSEIRL